MPPIFIGMKCNCGNEFAPVRPDQKWCSEKCRNREKQKTRTRLAIPRPFVGLDGEGIGDKYVLLSSQNGASIASKKGLSTEQCLDFLLALPKGSRHTIRPLYVWFAFNYDINMILGDLPLKTTDEESGSIEILRRDNETKWRGYFIRYFPGKFFQIARGKWSHTSYDTWSFYGSTFEKALADFGLETPEIISIGKKARKDFSKWSLKQIAEYNDAELVSLSELTEKLRVAIRPLDIPMQSWHGPGAIAQGWLRKNKIGKCIPEIENEKFKAAVNSAYFGGRIDALGYGFSNPVYHYDLVSAYPSSACFLPDLSKITFEYRKGFNRDKPLYLAHVKWEVEPSAKWGVFPWRSKNGTIRYPLSGEGWYWFPEVKAAIEHYPWKFRRFDIEECWEGKGEITYPLAPLIREAFEYRKELKSKGDLSHIAIKLMLNSIYGKFAQTVGKPRYHCLIWAGLITSRTRSELMRVIDGNTLCVMTDSIWSREPLNVSLGDGLGEWEKQNENQMVLAEAGLYSATDSHGKTTLWQRGFNKETPLDIPGIVRGWLDGEILPQTYTVNRFIGMGLASMTSFPWRNWVEMKRSVHPVPLSGTTKRFPHFPHADGCDCESADFVELDLKPADDDCASYPYQKQVLDTSLMELRLQDECEE